MFSTLSFSVQKHICAGEVADVSIIGNVDRCVMPDDQNHSDSSSIQKEPCCKDVITDVKSTNENIKVSHHSQLNSLQLVAIFVYTYFNLVEVLDNSITLFQEYSPPYVNKDIQVLYDTFII